MYASEARRVLNEVLDKVESGEIPMISSMDFYGWKPSIHWHIQEDLEGSRAVVNAFPGDWTVHSVSTSSEPVFDYEDDEKEITVWVHPDAFRMIVEVPR